jgi:hypothetical protein
MSTSIKEVGMDEMSGAAKSITNLDGTPLKGYGA